MCSDLITSERLLENITLPQLELTENKASVLLTIIENMLGLTEKNLITSGAARIH
jgi:hypothetical protein